MTDTPTEPAGDGGRAGDRRRVNIMHDDVAHAACMEFLIEETRWEPTLEYVWLSGAKWEHEHAAAYLYAVSDQLGAEHSSRGCAGCPICTARNLIEGFTDDHSADWVTAAIDARDARIREQAIRDVLTELRPIPYWANREGDHDFDLPGSSARKVVFETIERMLPGAEQPAPPQRQRRRRTTTEETTDAG